MSQVRGFIKESLAYMLAKTKLGYRITYLSEEMERLRETDLAIKSITRTAPYGEKAPLYGGCSIDLARKALGDSKDPRYVKNPFYHPKKHNQANAHYLFDEIKQPSEHLNSDASAHNPNQED